MYNALLMMHPLRLDHGSSRQTYSSIHARKGRMPVRGAGTKKDKKPRQRAKERRKVTQSS
jgi:hypothetical protein